MEYCTVLRLSEEKYLRMVRQQSVPPTNPQKVLEVEILRTSVVSSHTCVQYYFALLEVTQKPVTYMEVNPRHRQTTTLLPFILTRRPSTLQSDEIELASSY